jgi:hypothetical protein
MIFLGFFFSPPLLWYQKFGDFSFFFIFRSSLVLGPLKNFHTILVLVLGPGLIFLLVWGKVYIYLILRPVQNWYKAGVTSIIPK